MNRLARFTLIGTLTLLATSAGGLGVHGQSSSTLNGHTVRLDATGKLLSWTATQADAYGQVADLSANFLLNNVPNGSNGLKLYYSYSYADPGTPVRPVQWPHNPAGLFAMLTDSGLGYYAYSGNPAIATLVRNVLTYHLDHGMTPSTWHWPSVPFASGDPGSTEYRGASWGNSTGVGDGTGVIQPDKVGELGAAFLDYYRFAGEVRFRDAAIQAADVLASHVRVGTATRSPWPFRVYGQTNAVREDYSAHVVSPIRLFDNLIRLNLGNVEAYRTARQIAWDWMMAYPIRNNVWANYFEDVPLTSDTSNVNQMNAGEVARYLMQHPEMDANWESHVRGIIAWIESTFGSTQHGATVIAEQMRFFHVMGSHTSRYASLNAQLFELTGDTAAREKAYRSFNWATYMCSTTGMCIDGPTVNTVWWTDGYGDYIKHFLAGLGSVPEWSSAGASHLLRSTSIVKSIQYAAQRITYQVSDEASKEVFRLNFEPSTVVADGVSLPKLHVVDGEGWTFDAATGVLRVRHDSATQIVVSGIPLEANQPPSVTLTSPAGGTQVTTSLTLAANATDSDGTIDRVVFYQNQAVLGTDTTAPYSLSWSNIAPGTYQLAAVAVDDRGAQSTSTQTVTIVAPSTSLALSAAVNAATVTLSWTPSVNPTDEYRIYRSTATGFTADSTTQVGQVAALSFADIRPAGGTFYYRVRAVSTSGVLGTLSNEVAATIGGSLKAKTVVFSDGTGTRTASLAVGSGDLLLAFVSADGPSSGSQAATITGAGLTWTVVKRVNTQRGASEIWRALAATASSSASVTSTLASNSYHQSLTVVSFTGAGGVGASATASGSSGSPRVSLTTTRAGALVYGVGNDWDRAVARVAAAGQSLVHQWVDTGAGDTYWVQALASPVAATATTVELLNTSPTTSRWNYAAVEIVPAVAVPLKRVPNLAGLAEGDVSAALLAAELVAGTVSREASATVPAGTVIRQSPAADTEMAAGSAVSVVVSTGPALVTVPNLAGQAQGIAEGLLSSAQLTLGTVTIYPHATIPAGGVISQSPNAGSQVIAGSRVNLVVSSGPQLVAVPSVVGQTQTQAQSTLVAGGLTLGTVGTQPSQSVPPGSIISQTPAAGSDTIAGSAVNVIVSGGPTTVAVPNVAGQPQGTAQAAITAAGLAVGTITSQASATVAAGLVISQSPSAQTQAAQGSPVNLVISTGASAPSSLAVARTLFSDGTGTRTAAAFNSLAGELILAFVSSDGPTGRAQSTTVTGGGLTWTLVRRINVQNGVSEIWWSTTPSALTNLRVAATPSISGYHQSLTVVGFSGAAGIGSSAVASGATGAPSVSLTTSGAGSLVYAVGNDWDRAIARSLAAGQTIVHQWVDTGVGDTFWVQSLTAAVPASGTPVQLRATSPTTDRWNFAAVEILKR